MSKFSSGNRSNALSYFQEREKQALQSSQQEGPSPVGQTPGDSAAQPVSFRGDIRSLQGRVGIWEKLGRGRKLNTEKPRINSIYHSSQF